MDFPPCHVWLSGLGWFGCSLVQHPTQLGSWIAVGPGGFRICCGSRGVTQSGTASHPIPIYQHLGLWIAVAQLMIKPLNFGWFGGTSFFRQLWYPYFRWPLLPDSLPAASLPSSLLPTSFATPVMLQTASNPMSPVHSLPELHRIFGLKI